MIFVFSVVIALPAYICYPSCLLRGLSRACGVEKIPVIHETWLFKCMLRLSCPHVIYHEPNQSIRKRFHTLIPSYLHIVEIRQHRNITLLNIWPMLSNSRSQLKSKIGCGRRLSVKSFNRGPPSLNDRFDQVLELQQLSAIVFSSSVYACLGLSRLRVNVMGSISSFYYAQCWRDLAQICPRSAW